MLRGHCLCGLVKIEVDEPVAPATVCHCGMCRRWHGSPGAYISARPGTFRLEGEEHVRTYFSSPGAERGFCGACGGKIFWRKRGSAALDPALGLLDSPTGIFVGAHIWVAHKGDYYRIGDGLPCYAESPRDSEAISEPKTETRNGEIVRNGSCLCGSVAFRLNGPMRNVVACHCAMCRRWHGYFPAYTSSRVVDIALEGEAEISWFASSDQARRGFCRRCGSSMFWVRNGADKWSIAAGCLDQPTGLKTVRHIFVADKGDSYRITDGVRQMPESMASDPVTF